MKRHEIPITRKIELEEILNTIGIPGIIQNRQNFNIDELLYILISERLPQKEFEDYIATYDAARPKVDELEFIHHLSIKYNTHPDYIIKRIRDIRKINKYLNEQENNLKK